ncbi:vWA domain-containing protein [Fuerstiella marisgermanici]|uniref:Calcium-activated chloride channel protein 1 n=1 Tax=Fuerstiella marisgermanici TaxID=1891926 RepID=A0A1P8WQR7_9PLAN|nr:vWA domain-containing protein [Fuerstiella marisgermanici]APZ96394.1 calcium-activated chloride channel protein 1 [Fuerstiella marisgermanici]
MLLLVMVALLAIIGATVFGVDVAFMQLARTELRAAADAAAKAGAEALVRTQSETDAAAAAIRIASLNTVAGEPLVLTSNDIAVGQSIYQEDGTWVFTEGLTPATAVQVTAFKSDTTSAGAIDLLFGGFLGTSKFAPRQTAVASHFSQDVVLAVDRSHSMCFDFSGTDWSYPSGTPTSPDPVCYPPNDTYSRWAATMSAIDTYLTVCATNGALQRTAMLSWGSEITLDDYEGGLCNKTEVATFMDVLLDGTHQQIRDALNQRASEPMLGGTNMNAGLDASIDLLVNDSRPLAKRSIVLLTDGRWTVGSNPINAANRAKSLDIIIHVVSLLDSVDLNGMDRIAATTGGKHIHASNQAELEAAFRELALTLPVVLTK